MSNIRGIDSFVKAVQSGSIAAAARQQGISAAAASQNIARLEEELGTRLLTRTTRTLALTESGRIYYDRVATIIADLEQARDHLARLRDQPSGHLRIASSTAFGRTVIAAMIPEFCAAFPQISIELIMTDDTVDHIADNIDVSVRFREQLEPSLIARKIASTPIFICAAPAFLQRHGSPQAPEDLKQFDCLLYRLPVTGKILDWGFVRDGLHFKPELKAKIVCNDIHALAKLAIAGAGIVRLGSFVAEEPLADGRLVALFQDQKTAGQMDAAPLEFYLCVRDKLAETPKIRAFIDFVTSHPATRRYRG